jgi:hypothetical protein
MILLLVRRSPADTAGRFDRCIEWFSGSGADQVAATLRACPLDTRGE